MLQSCPIEKSVHRKGDSQEFYERHSSSGAEELESFVEDLVADEDDEDHREDDESVSEEGDIDPVESDDIVESEDEQHDEEIEDDEKSAFRVMEQIDPFGEEPHEDFRYQSDAEQCQTERYAEDRHGYCEEQRAIDAEDGKSHDLPQDAHYQGPQRKHQEHRDELYRETVIDQAINEIGDGQIFGRFME